MNSPATHAMVRPAGRPGLGMLALYLLLGFAAGLPFYMFSTVLALRLTAHGVGLVVIGFFAWVTLLPTFKFLWAPLLDRYDVPGFGRYWGRRRGWIMLAQLGIVTAMAAMAWTAADRSLAVTALFATLLAFWTTTLEVAADAWRIELAPTEAEQGPIVAANLWGYRSAMVAAGSGALIVADRAGWSAAYLGIAAIAFVPFPLLVAMRPDAGQGAGQGGGAGWRAVRGAGRRTLGGAGDRARRQHPHPGRGRAADRGSGNARAGRGSRPWDRCADQRHARCAGDLPAAVRGDGGGVAPHSPDGP